LYFYIRYINDNFETVKRYQLRKAIDHMINDLGHKLAEPVAIIDDKGNSVYNRKELILLYNDECKKGIQSYGSRNNNV